MLALTWNEESLGVVGTAGLDEAGRITTGRIVQIGYFRISATALFTSSASAPLFIRDIP
jgi:hypothetical protein